MPRISEMTGISENLPTSPDDLMAVLNQLHIDFQLHHHDVVHSVQEASVLYDSIPGVHCRNLFLRDHKKRPVLVVAQDDTPVDLKFLQSFLRDQNNLPPAYQGTEFNGQFGRFSFGSAERLWGHLGVRPGSVCPFSLINDQDCKVLPVLDAKMMQADAINFHPMVNSMTVTITPNGLNRFLAHTGHVPVLCDFA